MNSLQLLLKFKKHIYFYQSQLGKTHGSIYTPAVPLTQHFFSKKQHYFKMLFFYYKTPNNQAPTTLYYRFINYEYSNSVTFFEMYVAEMRHVSLLLFLRILFQASSATASCVAQAIFSIYDFTFSMQSCPSGQAKLVQNCSLQFYSAPIASKGKNS